MLRIYRRLKYILYGIYARLLMKVGIKMVPENASCLNCKYGYTDEEKYIYDCDPPGMIPESFYKLGKPSSHRLVLWDEGVRTAQNGRDNMKGDG